MKNLLFKMAKPFFSGPLSRIQKFKDVYAGESCYLFGDGVSIKWFDLNAFSDKKSIPCGFIPLHHDFEKLDVSTLLLMEPWWFYPWQKTTSPPVKFVKNELQKMYKQQVLKKYPEKQLVTSITNFPVLNRKNALFTFRQIEDPRLPNDYITNQFNCFAGSLRASILMAIYMGFKSCYLVGFDYTHFPSKSGHWYEKGKGIENGLLRHDEEFLFQANKYISITTVTLDGGSETVDAVTYKELTGETPVYRENTGLVSLGNLESFSKWPGYTIF